MADGAKYRYPGPQEFEDTPTDSRRFFGRTHEISTVAERIVASRLLVVYGGSGLGKSSLLKAGVFPKLRSDNLLPIRVRLNKPGGSVLELLQDACAESARDTSHELGIDYTPGQGQTAWEFFRTVMFWRGERLVPPVLVFDQFEEIFTLADAAWRKEFGREIGPLASGNAPAAIRERLRGGERGLSDQAPNVKLVFCLREEYYGSLQDLSSQFPGLFQDRFRLRALDSQRAELAIVEPARLKSGESSADSFVTPPFEYERAAIDSMLDFLQGRSLSIEPVPLQLLCQYVEQVIVEGKRKAGVSSPIVVTAGDLGGKKAMNKVIGRFYRDSIDSLPPSERRHARELCDTGLLAPAGNRLLLEKGQIVKDYKVSDATLRYLTDERRILRQEPRLESTFYEISHDTIASSIRDSRKWRLPRQWRIAGAVSVGFVIALAALTVYALVLADRARRASNFADSESRDAKDAAVRAENSEKKAKRSLTEAEGMVAFLMGEDFLAKLRPMGRLNVFEEMQKAAPCKQPENGVEYSDVGLKNLGLACLNEGDIYYGQFHLREAGDRYETARLHFAGLARRNNNGSDENLAEALFKLARVAEDQLDLDRSLDLTRESLKMQEQLVAGGSSDDKLLRDRANSYLYVGDIREKQGYLREALANYERAVALSGQNNSAEWLYIRQDALMGETSVFARQGNLTRSEESAKKAYECAKEAAEKSPFAPEAKYRVGVALSKLPASENQKPDDRLREYEEIFNDVASAATWDPKNKAWARDVAATHILLGQAHVALNQWDKAAEHYKTAIPMVVKLLEIDPTNRQLNVDLLLWVHESLGQAYAASHGEFAAAMKPATATGERESGSNKGASPSPESKVASDKSRDALGEFLSAQKLLQPLEVYAPENLDVRYWVPRLALSVSYLQRSDHQTSEAIKTCDHALRELGRARDPTDSSYWEWRHQLETERAEALAIAGEHAKAGEAFRAAAASVEWLLVHFPPSADEWTDKFVLYYYHIAPFRRSQKDAPGELAAYQQAFGAIEKAVVLRPQDAGLQSKLALAHQQIGDSLRDSGQFDQAQEHYGAAQKGWTNAFQLKDGADYQNRLFLLFYDHVAELRRKQKDDAGVRKAYQESLGPIMKAAELDPTDATYQSNLASAYMAVGDSFRDSGKFVQAQEHYSSAEKAWRNAFQLRKSADYQNYLFMLFDPHVAELRKLQKDDAALLKAYQDALDAEHQAVALAPKVLDYRVNTSLALWRIGALQSDKHQALETFRLALESLHEALSLEGKASSAQRAYAQIGCYVILHDNIAPILHDLKDTRGEFSALNEALAAAQAAVDLVKDNASYQADLGQANLGVGDFLWQQGADKTGALQSYIRAEQSFREAAQLSPNEARYWSSLADACRSQGLIQQDKSESLATQTSYRNALSAIEQAMKLKPDASTRQLRDEVLKKLGPNK